MISVLVPNDKVTCEQFKSLDNRGEEIWKRVYSRNDGNGGRKCLSLAHAIIEVGNNAEMIDGCANEQTAVAIAYAAAEAILDVVEPPDA